MPTKFTKQIEWLPEYDKVCDKINQSITSEPGLTIFESDLPVQLHTDAQMPVRRATAPFFSEKHSKLYLVVYYCKRTTGPESLYHSYELETLALINAVKHFCNFLVGRHFMVITNCKSLKASWTKKDLTPCIHRWWAFLQALKFDIVYYRKRSKKKQQETHRFLVSKPVTPNRTVIKVPAERPTKTVQVIDLYLDWLMVVQQLDDKISKF